jgi:hypothetical protein
VAEGVVPRRTLFPPFLEETTDRIVATNKKTDVVEHPWVLLHVGLLFNEPPGPAGLLFIESSDDIDRDSGCGRPPIAIGRIRTSLCRAPRE